MRGASSQAELLTGAGNCSGRAHPSETLISSPAPDRGGQKPFPGNKPESATPALKEAFESLFTTLAIPPDQFARIKAPTLVVTSTHDIVPFTVATALSEGIPQSLIFVVERAGHTPMWERPDRFCQGVFQFLYSAL
jgi:pimeloyl-ACP methyl ester carboxylesterase